MPLRVVTCTLPVVSLLGTVVVIPVSDTTVKVAGVPLKVTPVKEIRLWVPRLIGDAGKSAALY